MMQTKVPKVPIDRRRRQRTGLLLALLLGAASAPGEDFDFFERRVRPVLVEHCYRCHSESSDKLKGGLRLDTREGLRTGGESGQPAIVPGNAQGSLLVQALRYTNEKLQMPPKGPLQPQQVEDLVTWINAGAPDPRTNALVEFKAQLARSSKHWAFQLPRATAPPRVKQTAWPRTPLDQFILAKLEQVGLGPSTPADRRTLLRRVAYDLTGLPPAPEEVEAFLADRSPRAFATVVDRYLSSPHYGERWGRHWLDVARYSDTKGYVYDREEKQFVHAHVYRDWVIRALNEDLPYDQFLLLQIAADQSGADTTQATATENPALAALGFLTIGRRFLGVRHDIIDDRIDVLTRGTLGLTVACARCHDHKYDPVSMRDYYALYGIFNASAERTVPLRSPSSSERDSGAFWKGLRERETKLLSTFQKKRAEFAGRLRAKTPEYLRAVLDVSKLPSEEFYSIMSAEDLNPVVVRQWEGYLFKNQDRFDPIFALWHAWAKLPRSTFASGASTVLQRARAEVDPGRRIHPLVLEAFTNAPASMDEVATRYGAVFAAVEKAWRDALAQAPTNGAAAPTALDPPRESLRQILYGPDSPASVPNGAIVDIEWFFDESTRVELAKLQADIDRWIIKAPDAPPHAVILADRPNPRNARVLLRGNPANPGEEAPRRFIEVLANSPNHDFVQGSGRLELARAIASRDNPLTARVMVNRVWHHHFGAGLVRTTSDLGLRAEAPSHPELLDWLAVRLIEEGWSMKQLHRLILLSAVYQQSSDAPSNAKGLEIDPANRLLWRMNKHRLDFEGMRDSLLVASGELDRRLGGKPVELFSNPPSARRAVYGYVDRQFVPGVLRIFDFANPDLHIPQRSDTTVPQQALFFMNDPFVLQRARNLAARLPAAGSVTSAERVQELYRRVYQRVPTKAQLAAGLEFVSNAIVEAPEPVRPAPATAWQYGYGAVDAQAGRVTNFTALPHFTGQAWQGGPQWPDARLGWVQLTAEGGHAGNDLQHAAIRRWIAPRDAVLSIRGAIHHEHEAGDGITARIVSSRFGALGTWSLRNEKAEAKLESVQVRQGDTIDFVVDLREGLNSDMFKWAPTLRCVDSNAAIPPQEWSAKSDFNGPPLPPPPPLAPWEKYAQVLLEANEFMFVD